MAAAAAAARGAPMTLRDFLELGCESSSDGFRSFPRCLPRDGDSGGVVQKQRQKPARVPVEEAELRRSPPWSPSAFFLPKSPGALARISSLSRSFSRRLSFWRRRDDDEVYVDERDSCGFPSPLVSSCSASDTESEYAESVAHADTEANPASMSMSASECDKPSSSSSSSSSSSGDRDCTGTPGAAGDATKKEAEPVGRNMEMEDKQQLSPVSVLDFLFDDDDGDERSDAGTCSPSFQLCSPDLQRTKTTPLHKIRRFDGLAQELDPVDLDARFTAPESGESVDAHSRCTHLHGNSGIDDNAAAATTTTSSRRLDGEELESIEQEGQEPDEHHLLRRLLQDTSPVDEVTEALLLDFFADEVHRMSSAAGAVVGTVRPVDAGKAAALVGTAGEWLRGAGPRWGVDDVMFSGEAALADMERSRRWMCVRDEERDVGAVVAGMVTDGLVDELVVELAAAPWWCGDGDKWYDVELGSVV